MNKIYSILVIYNPNTNELYNVIDRLKKQTDIVLVCNNSDYDIDINIDIENDEQVKLFNFGENLGIAKAQSIGMKWAFTNGADFILQIDQDSIPSDDLLTNLFQCYEELMSEGYKVGLIGSQDYDRDTMKNSKAFINKEIQINDTSYYVVPDILSSGSLIPRHTYELLGGMDDDLFIDIVDFEYCWRIRSKGYLIIKNKKALLAHKLGDGETKLFNLFPVNTGSAFRHYYQFRNILFMMNRNYVPFKWKITQLIKLLIKLLIYPFGLKDGFKRLKFMLMGIKDYIINKQGKL